MEQTGMSIGAVILWSMLSMFDGALMFQVNFPVDDLDVTTFFREIQLFSLQQMKLFLFT